MWTVPLLAALVAPAAAAADRPVRVGAKVFTESAILDQIAVQRLTADGVPAVTGPPLSGTDTLFKALLADQVDVYPEYTGTIAQQILHDPALTTDAAIASALARRGVAMTGPLGFDDTYAVGLTDARAAALHVNTLGDLAAHPDLRLAFSTEFARRPDGWPGVRAAYALPDLPVQAMDHELAYRALLGGSVDATDLYSTDAEIDQHHLRVLVDDRHFFPAYRAVYLYRAGLAPAAAASLNRLAGRIDAVRMRAMNKAAKVDHRPESAVAADFLDHTFAIRPTAAALAGPSAAWELWRFTRQHLTLVGLSLAAAVVVAVPLGVAAAEFPRFGHVALAVVSAIYTVPSLALLVFMIPLLGIGFRPAVVALFLYSLLPIVRNTQAGLRAIPASLRESAEVLGLGRWARLRRVEVPMASPAILAGIKTSAVLNVGTATLGALIGAGGYGQPILDGIRLEDTHRLLLGAVPAALMALAIQGGFDLLEPLVVPRGLRLRPSAD